VEVSKKYAHLPALTDKLLRPHLSLLRSVTYEHHGAEIKSSAKEQAG
jgi:hypothetical protein